LTLRASKSIWSAFELTLFSNSSKPTFIFICLIRSGIYEVREISAFCSLFNCSCKLSIIFSKSWRTANFKSKIFRLLP
jgi:hypothetical protein